METKLAIAEEKRRSHYFAQTYRDAWDDYRRMLLRAEFPRWDFVILTASNEQQAEGFRAQLQERKDAGLLPEKTQYVVLPDEGDVRVGSGGATLAVIRYIAQATGRTDFTGLRVLCIHSGGDSKRVPQYSALGKLFSPVPRELPNGRASTLFDEFMIAMAAVPSRIREGMLLVSGDVLLLFNPLQIDYSGNGAAAISFKADVQTGKNHGVFLRGQDGNVRAFLHKMSVEALQAAGAVNERGAVDIDTGAVIFSAKMLESLYSLVNTEARYRALVNDKVRLSLYGDFLYPLAEESTLEKFYSEKPEGEFCKELEEARTQVWQVLRPFRMKLLRLAPAKFIHFGTTKEILQLMSGGVDAYRELGWARQACSSVAQGAAGYCSVLSDPNGAGENSYLEVSFVHSKARIGSRSILSYVELQEESIPDEVVLHGLKQRDGRFVARIYGIMDNPKDKLEEGCTFLGTTLEEFVRTNGLKMEELWQNGAHTLWDAQLYPACSSISEAVAAALNLYEMAQGRGDVQMWRAAQRKSLSAGFRDADPQALIAWERRMQELVRMDRIAALIREGKPAMLAKGILQSDHLTKVQKEWLEKRLHEADYSERMRLYYYIGTAIGGRDGEEMIGKCFATIQEAVTRDTMNALVYSDACRIGMEEHTVRLPLRVNFGGGWSDTPPYCIEQGGTVLNAAILLGGEKPVQVTLTRLEEKKVVFISRDMGVHEEFTEIEPLQATGDPYDPCALQKAALLACGVIPRQGDTLEAVLGRLGGGFMMQSEVTGVPKGSGLGTSSILAAACVKALSEFMGLGYSQEELYSQVLCMEQIMSTGGGWQDQVGGLSGGVKYITSLPGLQQKLRVEMLHIPDAIMRDLQERFCLIYTGQRRLARNLLRDVVGHYVGNEPQALRILNEIQRTAALMRFELERGHVDDFAKLMDAHWELLKELDHGSSNTLIEQIFDSIADLIDGRMICGAGGGGFLQVILKKGVDEKTVHERLKDVFQDNDIDVWECTMC